MLTTTINTVSRWTWNEEIFDHFAVKEGKEDCSNMLIPHLFDDLEVVGEDAGEFGEVLRAQQ